MTAGESYLDNPMELPFIPNWNRVLSAIPDFGQQLRAAVAATYGGPDDGRMAITPRWIGLTPDQVLMHGAGVEVLLDDRAVRPGVMFNDIELIGIPHRLVISDKTLAQEQIEYKRRGEAEAQMLPLAGIEQWLQQRD